MSASSQAGPTRNGTTVSPLDLVIEHLRAEDAHDVPAILATFADDCIYRIPAYGVDLVGKESIGAFYADMFHSFSDFTNARTIFHVADDAVFVEVTTHRTHDHAWGPFPATGRHIATTSLAQFPVTTDGLLGGEIVYVNPTAIMQQIGAINSADLLAEVARRRPLLGRVAVVTGGSRGIGAAIARAFVDAGGSVVLVGRDRDALGRVREELHAAGGAASVVVADVTAVPDVDQLFGSVAREFGRLDILVNAAGGTRRGPALEMTEADWDAIQTVNLKAAFLCSQRAARVMRSAGSGAIINVASLNSTVGNAWAASYAASKGGIVQLTKSLALEWADLGIRVNAIGPGFIETEMTAPLLKDDVRRDRILSHIPMARFGNSDEVGGLAVYLASDAASYVTGQVMYADGGYLCV